MRRSFFCGSPGAGVDATGVPGLSPGRIHLRLYLLALFWSALLLGGWLAPPARAQSNTSLVITVLDSLTSLPLEGATVTVLAQSVAVSSDPFGQLRLDRLDPGWCRLRVECGGYVPREAGPIEVRPIVAAALTVRLVPDPVEVGGLVVTDSTAGTAGQVTRITRRQLDTMQPSSLPEALSLAGGIDVQQSGNGNGAVIRMRGSSPEQVLVLVDGQRVNSPTTGTADLSSIPIDAVESIEIFTGSAGAVFGADALAGAVNIVTRKPLALAPTRMALHQAWGDWGARAGQYSLFNPIGASGLSTQVVYNRQSSRSDYDYSYSVAPTDVVYAGTRGNNEFERQSVLVTGRYAVSRHSQADFSAQWLESSNGLPGAASDPNPYGERDDRRLLFSARVFAELSRRISVELHSGFTRYDHTFVDRRSPKATQFDVDHENGRVDSRAALHLRPLPGASVTVGGEASGEQLDHQDRLTPALSTGRTSRRLYAASIRAEQTFHPGGPVIDGAGVTAAWRYDYARSEAADPTPIYPWDPPRLPQSTDGSSPTVSLSASHRSVFEFTVQVSYGRAFRVPPLNALYWGGGPRSRGNPDLKPEQSEQSELRLTLGKSLGRLTVSAGTAFYRRNVTDQIVWLLGGLSEYHPVNLGRARIDGREDCVDLNLYDGIVVIRYVAASTDARNRVAGHTTYDKHLVHVPDYSTSLHVAIGVDQIGLRYSLHSVGRRYALDNNTKWYDPYRTHDLALRCGVRLFDDWRLSLETEWRNVTDEDYVLVAQYPMPPGGVTVGLTLDFTPAGGDDLSEEW